MPQPIGRSSSTGILDVAAGLFARHGYDQTSVQTVADAVGLSKAGLLHHFPSKDALGEAVSARSQDLMREVVAEVATTPAGPARDRLALEIMVDQAMRSPGLVAFSVIWMAGGGEALSSDGLPVFEAFGGVGRPGSARHVRVVAALAGLGMLALVAHEHGWTTTWRNRIVDATFDTLGHPEL